MDSHKVTFSALQKYYSALKALDSFSSTNDFFDAIAYLDSFFTEFRNITFVIQKELDSDSRVIYEKLKEKYLKSENMRWFIDTRNVVTKQTPFNLNKTLIIEVYLPTETISLQNSSFTAEIYEPLDLVVSSLKKYFIEEYSMTEVFLSSKIIFSEDGNEVDIYPKMIEGIKAMSSFLMDFLTLYLCDCNICNELHRKNKNLYYIATHNDVKFIKDYVIDKTISEGDLIELKVHDDNSDLIDISSARVQMDKTFFSKYWDDDNELFNFFIDTHIRMYILQRYKIMPTFIIIYNDKTLRIIPMIAEIKSTFYRKVKAISDLEDFHEIKVVFYCGESYLYQPDSFHHISQLPYSQRIKKAQCEVLTFTMLSVAGTEKTMCFEKDKIEKKSYINEIKKESNIIESSTVSEVDWLKPIRQKFQILMK